MSAKVLAVILACLAFGCSEVLIEPDGTGGRNGDGDGDGDGARTWAGTGTETGTGTQAAASSSTGFDQTLNEQFCEAAGQCFASCVGASQSFQHAPCEDEGALLVECLVDHYDAMACTVSGCQAEMDALLACRATDPVDCYWGGCAGGDKDCACTGECPSGQQQVICSNENGQAECTCYLNAIVAGTCTTPWGDGLDTCGFGCCAAVFGSQP